MSNKRTRGPNATTYTSPTENDIAQITPPQDLYPTSDIRFVMVELGKTSSDIQNLAKTIEKQSSQLDTIDNKLHTIEKKLHGFYVAGAVIAVVAVGFWWLEGERIAALLKQPIAISTQQAAQPSIADVQKKQP